MVRKQLVDTREVKIQFVSGQDHEGECLPPWNDVEQHSTKDSFPDVRVFERKGRYLIQIGERDGPAFTGFGLIIDPR